MTSKTFSTSWRAPEQLIVDTGVIVTDRRMHGIHTSRNTVIGDLLRRFFDDGGLPVLRDDPHSIVDLYQSGSIIHTALSMEMEIAVEVKTQILAERDHELWWTVTETVIVALHRYLEYHHVDLLKATWHPSPRAIRSFEQVCQTHSRTPRDFLEAVLLAAENE